MPTVKTIVGEKFIPGLLHHFLAEVAYTGQQTNISINPDRANNLFAPVPQDRGAHGDFDDQAQSSSFQLWASMNRGWLAVAGVGCLLSLGWARRQSQLNRSTTNVSI